MRIMCLYSGCSAIKIIRVDSDFYVKYMYYNNSNNINACY